MWNADILLASLFSLYKYICGIVKQKTQNKQSKLGVP